jgi:hypothetical protein
VRGVLGRVKGRRRYPLPERGRRRVTGVRDKLAGVSKRRRVERRRGSGVRKELRRGSRSSADTLEHLLQPLPLGLQPRLLVSQLGLLSLRSHIEGHFITELSLQVSQLDKRC